MTIGRYLSYGEPIKGWMLLMALSDDNDNSICSGQWILAYSKFIFQRQAVLRPSFVFDAMPFNSDDIDSDEGARALLNRAREFEASMRTDPQTGYGFYHCCLSDGFDPFKDDFFTWVAERITEKAFSQPTNLADSDLQRLLDTLVAREEYEKAAEIRDLLQSKHTKGLGMF